jgi:hypothetical protein
VAGGILSGPLDADGPSHRRPQYPTVAGTVGLAVQHRGTGVRGVVLKANGDWVVFRDQAGREHTQRNRPGGFLVDGRPATLTAPPRAAAAEAARTTASGSIALPEVAARVARASRIWVEGIHDAELVERVWGDDLRVEGVVVEPLHGADDLASAVRRFGPRPGRRLGILLDHLVEGSKEDRLARQIDHPDVLVRGHPYVDVWEGIRPQVIGLPAWPRIPKGTDWKTGICRALRFDGEPGELWRRLLKQVRSYRDLEPALVGAVEELIDFVAPPSASG